jgi:hypothetical protein
MRAPERICDFLGQILSGKSARSNPCGFDYRCARAARRVILRAQQRRAGAGDLSFANPGGVFEPFDALGKIIEADGGAGLVAVHCPDVSLD